MSNRNASREATIDRTATTIGSRLRTETSGALSAIGKLRIPEFVLFFGLIFEGSMFGLPIPLNQVVMVGIILLAITRRPQVELGRLQLLVPLLVIGLFYIGMISMFADPTEFAFDWKRRLIRLALTAVLLMVLASGRIDFRSGLAGLGVGMIFNAFAFYAGFAPDNYGGYLSGFFEDKNVAGMAYAVFGVLMLAVVERRWARVLLVLLIGVLVWETGSRTSIAALAAGVGWIVLAPKLSVLGRWLLGIAIVIGVSQVAEDYSQIGVFSDREGSDLLRSRIDGASEVKVHDAGFFGSGLGEAYVVFDDDPGKVWLFHDSYWTALVEGGWPWLLIVLGVTVVFALRPFARELSRQEIVAQAATVTTLICAWRLGEVLFTLQWALVIAIALYAHARARDRSEAEEDSSPEAEAR
ncbi:MULTISPECIES: ABC transporter permease [Brachybacterium]|uniref:ABC transporter permease n=1 Tax=Brachybacterium TaxID=43668 RepID=UPI0021A70D23|nr:MULTISPECIES: ABC transporter permease [Brachybacterium]MCT1908961.1 ABC transporter permease [Brachybacterium paraconglomeratum]